MRHLDNESVRRYDGEVMSFEDVMNITRRTQNVLNSYSTRNVISAELHAELSALDNIDHSIIGSGRIRYPAHQVSGICYSPHWAMAGRASRAKSKRTWLFPSRFETWEYQPRRIKERKELEEQKRQLDKERAFVQERISEKGKLCHSQAQDEEVEAAAQPAIVGKHEAHDRRGNNTHLISDFKRLKQNDEFCKETLEESLWYAKEFFLEKQGFKRLKAPTQAIVPYLVNWCKGEKFPTIERFAREEGKKKPDPSKRKQIKVRRLLLKGLVRVTEGPFSESVKYYLAGKLQDEAQSFVLKFLQDQIPRIKRGNERVIRALKKCCGVGGETSYISDAIDNKVINSLNLASGMLDSKVQNVSRMLDQKIRIIESKAKHSAATLGDRKSVV